MSSINIIGPGNRVPPARQDQRSQLRLALAALAMPAFFVIGFTLCYTSALQAPAPHGVLETRRHRRGHTVLTRILGGVR
jgi:hypothetical protein